MTNPAPPLDLDRPGVAIGARVRELREHRQIAISKLADAAGMSVRNLLAIEDGRQQDMHLSTFLRLAQALRVKPATLLPERLPAPLPRQGGLA